MSGSQAAKYGIFASWCFAGLELGSCLNGIRNYLFFCAFPPQCREPWCCESQRTVQWSEGKSVNYGSWESPPQQRALKHTKSHLVLRLGTLKLHISEYREGSVTWHHRQPEPVNFPLQYFKGWRGTGLAQSPGNRPGHPPCLLFLLFDMGEQVWVAHCPQTLLWESRDRFTLEQNSRENSLASPDWTLNLGAYLHSAIPQPFLCLIISDALGTHNYI